MSELLTKKFRVPVRVCPETGKEVLGMYSSPNNNVGLIIQCRRAYFSGGKCPLGRKYTCLFNLNGNNCKEVEICLQY